MNVDFHYMLIAALPIIWALTIHEFMHAWTALKCGDNTAWMLGRVTLNPMRHLEPIGTLCLFVGGFGWAKPVPVNPRLFRRPRLDDILVSVAGPGSNLMMAVVLCLVFRLLAEMIDPRSLLDMGRGQQFLLMTAGISVRLNFVLFLFNLLPIAPLDGHHVVRELLPWGEARERFKQLSRYGPIVLMIIVFGFRQPLQMIYSIIDPAVAFLAGEKGQLLMDVSQLLIFMRDGALP